MNLHVALAHLEQDKKLRPLLAKIEMPNFMPSGRLYYDLLAFMCLPTIECKSGGCNFQTLPCIVPGKLSIPKSCCIH